MVWNMVGRNIWNKNNEQIQKFDGDNSTLTFKSVCCVPDVKIDKFGNLWAGFLNYIVNVGYPQLHMLPAEKKFNKDVKDSDWITYSFGNMKTEFGVRFIIRVILLYTLIMNGKQN